MHKGEDREDTPRAPFGSPFPAVLKEVFRAIRANKAGPDRARIRSHADVHMCSRDEQAGERPAGPWLMKA